MILTEDQAREKLVSGINQVADLVKKTLGPKGRNVGFKGPFGTIFTNDGVTIAKQITLKDKMEDLGANLIKEVAGKTEDTSGDGTTTATVLAQAIVKEGMRSVVAGANPMEIKKGIQKAVDEVVDNLKNISKPIVSKDDIAKVATISSGDEVIGNEIAEVFDIIGKDGVISVEESGKAGIEHEIARGFKFDRGYISPYFVTDETMKSTLEDPSILVTDQKISSVDDLLPIMQALGQKGKRNVLIVAEDVTDTALITLVSNHIKGGWRIVAVKAPGFGELKPKLLEDLCIATGATFITSETNMKLSEVGLDMLGSASKVITDQHTTTIVEGNGDKELIKKRIEQIKSTETDGNIKSDRLSKINGVVGILKIGARTEAETQELKYRVTDAVEATKSALEEGVVAGGGIALLNSQLCLDDQDGSRDELIGRDIVRQSLNYPFKQIAENAGQDGNTILHVVNYKFNDNIHGWNAKTGEYGDMFEMGIIDPTKVTRCALQNAASIAALVLTTDGLIVENEKE